MKRILIILALGILSAQSDCIDGRYIDQNFNVNVIENVNENVNRDVNEHVNRNLNRNFN